MFLLQWKMQWNVSLLGLLFIGFAFPTQKGTAKILSLFSLTTRSQSSHHLQAVVSVTQAWHTHDEVLSEAFLWYVFLDSSTSQQTCVSSVRWRCIMLGSCMSFLECAFFAKKDSWAFFLCLKESVQHTYKGQGTLQRRMQKECKRPGRWAFNKYFLDLT